MAVGMIEDVILENISVYHSVSSASGLWEAIPIPMLWLPVLGRGLCDLLQGVLVGTPDLPE